MCCPSFNMWWSVGSDLHFSESPGPYFPSFASLWCSVTINIPTLSWGLLKAQGLIQGSSKTCKLSVFYCNSSPPPLAQVLYSGSIPTHPPRSPRPRLIEWPNSSSILLWPSNSQRGTTRSFVWGARHSFTSASCFQTPAAFKFQTVLFNQPSSPPF